MTSAQPFGVYGGLAEKPERRLAGGQIDHFDVFPGDAAGEPGSDCFHQRLFGGKARGEAFVPVGFAERVGNFARGEDSLEEAVSETGMRLLNARDFSQVSANRKDHVPIVAQVE